MVGIGGELWPLDGQNPVDFQLRIGVFNIYFSAS